MKRGSEFKNIYSLSRCIVMDTSFLIELFSKAGLLDDFRGRFINYNLLIPRSVYRELLELRDSGGKVSGFAGLALKFIDTSGVLVVDGFDGVADEDVVSLALDKGCYVATCDNDVINRCRERGIRLIFLLRGILTID